MIKLTRIIILLLPLIISCNNNSELYHSNGNLKASGQKILDKKEGKWKFYDQYGKLESIRQYKNDILHGVTKTYWSPKSLKNIRFNPSNDFIIDSVEGAIVKSILNYEKGVKQGKQIDYYTDLTKSISNYVNGKLEGEYKAYYSNGKLVREENYKNDQVIGNRKQYYKNGQLKVITPYLFGKRHGVVKSYYSSGNLYTTIPYKNHLRDGIQKFYYEDGALSAEHSYSRNYKHGKCVDYNNKGEIKSINYYLKNEEVHKGAYDKWEQLASIKETSVNMYISQASISHIKLTSEEYRNNSGNYLDFTVTIKNNSQDSLKLFDFAFYSMRNEHQGNSYKPIGFYKPIFNFEVYCKEKKSLGKVKSNILSNDIYKSITFHSNMIEIIPPFEKLDLHLRRRYYGSCKTPTIKVEYNTSELTNHMILNLKDEYAIRNNKSGDKYIKALKELTSIELTTNIYKIE